MNKRAYLRGLCVAILLAPAAGARGVMEKSELARKLRAANVLIDRDFDTSFECRMLPARPLTDDHPWVPESWEHFNTYRYVARGAELYAARTSYERLGGPHSDAVVNYRRENLWSNGTWHHRTDDELHVALYGQAEPLDLDGRGFIFSLIEGRYPSYRTLADIVGTGVTIDQSVEEGVLEHRFVHDSGGADWVQHVIRAKLEPAFEMLSYRIELSQAPDAASFAEHVHHTSTYSVLKWREVDGLRIPWRAQVEIVDPEDPRTRTGPPWVSRSLYTRTSFEFIEEENAALDELFVFETPKGTQVYDDRSKASYEIGQTWLHLDGTVYQLSEPILEHPGDRLGELIRDATPIRRGDAPAGGAPRGSGTSGAASVQEGEDAPWLRIALVAAFIGIAAALFAWLLLRLRGGRRVGST